MKKLCLTFILSWLVGFVSYSQKSNLVKADNYRKYDQLDNAKDAIDEATLNEQTRIMDKTWYYRGLIYHALYNHATYGYLCDHCLDTAYSAYMKANEISPSGEWASDISSVRLPYLSRDFFDRGVKEFNKGKYIDAMNSFEKVQKITPGDTSSLRNAAYSAEKAKNYEKAKEYYGRLVSMKYHDANIYMALSNIYKQLNDTTRALIAVQDGRKVFPDDMNLILAEINILLSLGRNSEAIEALESAVKRDSKNPTLYLALGSTYDKVANPKDANGKDLVRPINYGEMMVKAEQTYQHGLEVSPNNFELNYNLGAIFYNQAAEMNNAANNLKSVAEYDKAKLRYVSKFQDAQPYLEKALDISPNDRSTLLSLKELYSKTNQMDKYNRVKSILDNMK